ncbi:nucleoporin Ndc1 [Drosophila kikkawai]|uniref:Nucleoporin Ndc1 n=1 Tax=Drosophila kikkawai TaxID=30033 RepID=A0A6P4J192_DROKI|nr:nucleoporin Ndc1 [Drosophila kikkawai]
MWSDIILRALFGPSYVPHKIQKLLEYRFVFAVILGFLLDYQMLGIFLASQFFELRSTLNSVIMTLQRSMFSVYTMAMMVIIRVFVAGYGLILCHMHYAYPRCNGSKMKRIINDFPTHFSLLFSILLVAFASSWLYASYADPVEGYYLQILGCISGIFYFKTQHGFTLQRFPLPIVRLGLLKSIQQMWWPLLERSGREAFGTTIIFTMLFWPYMENIFNGLYLILTEPGILLRGWLVNTLILAKLRMVWELYGLIMQRQLPLSIDFRCQDIIEDICLRNIIKEWIKTLICRIKQQPVDEKPRYTHSLSISTALDSTHIYGFKVLAARDFYAEMSGSLWTELVAIEDVKNTSAYWEELRKVLYKIINDFLVKMDSCLDTAPRAQISDLLKRQTGIRSLVKPKEVAQGSLRKYCRAPQIEIQIQPTHLCICNIVGYLRELVHFYSGLFFPSYLVFPNQFAFLFAIDKLAKLNHVLQCGEPLVWILQGLVCICARSLREDSHGIVQKDLSWVFEVLIKVEGKLIAAAEVPVQSDRENGKLCPSHKLLKLATNRCLFKMLKTFGPHLNYIVNDQTLREELKSRMKILNQF